MILRGETGAGKSTFLDTVGLFRDAVTTVRVASTQDIGDALGALLETTEARIVVLEGREALGEVSAAALEAGMHAINAFLRTAGGRNTLIVWPANTDDLTERLVDLASRLGGEALLGIGDPVQRFGGPSRSQFVRIADRTVGALNNGASLAALGISSEQAEAMAEDAPTIGRYLALVRAALLRNGATVRQLLPTESRRMWTVVIAGNETDSDTAALTRGDAFTADIDRLISTTDANIVKDLKKHPDQLGILGTVLDAKILDFDIVTALAVARQFGSDKLHEAMKAAGMSTAPDKTASDRLLTSELGLVLAGKKVGTRKRGKKPGKDTVARFESLAKIASKDDGLINDAIGRGLQEVGLIESYQLEKDLGTELKFLSDIYLITSAGDRIRLEIMWRTQTSRAAISNYVLGKLGNYGRAIGLLA
ncbi:MAG: hypothetical protein JWQ18_65 [Conexibacter sp.]|nr:hypothetical protein [Conexibacter sp.]